VTATTSQTACCTGVLIVAVHPGPGRVPSARDRVKNPDLADGVGIWCQPEVMELNPKRFYDGGDFDGAGPDPDKKLRVCLERRVERPKRSSATAPEKELFTLERRIAYHHHAYRQPFIVPADREFRTDLTSVPWLFTWIVPRSGMHLPAALVHDALVDAVPPPADSPPDTAAAHVVTAEAQTRDPYIGPYVPREEADRVFRDAMADLGTGATRRWLAWTGVALNTMFKRLPGSGTPGWGVYFMTAMLLTVIGIAILGVFATLDLFDLWGVHLWWMGGWDDDWLGGALAGHGFWPELGRGAMAAVLIPVVASVFFWGRFWRAGVIAGVALALLLHVTVVMLVLSGLLLGVERATRDRRARALKLPVGPGPVSPSATPTPP
jgi:Protein of unknown function (DUF1353)